MIRIGTTWGMAGYFAVMYDTEGEHAMEPIQTGIGRHATIGEAESEARDWAKAEGVVLDFEEHDGE